MRRFASLTALVRLGLVVAASSLLEIWASANPGAPNEAAAAKLFSRSGSHGELPSLERRYAEVERQLAVQSPAAVRKMSEDPSEMFFPEYWHFELQLEEDEALERDFPRESIAAETETETAAMWDNSTTHGFVAPFLLHHDASHPIPLNLRNRARNLFKKRDYQCPSGFHNCNSIGFQDACCSRGQTCQIIQDTGVGVIGCCPRGNKCTGSVSTCDESNGYTSCPNRQNPNGCCAPGFVCDAIGCVKRNRATTVRTVSPVTVVTPTRTIVGVTTRTLVTTTVVSQTLPRTVYTTTTYPTSTRTIGPVVQSQSTNTQLITTTLTSAAPPVGGYCPTGFYRCSAFYLGGCCRVGRDCRSTNCPLIISAQATQNGVVTVVIATGEGVTTTVVRGGDTPPPTTVIPAATPTIPGGGACAEGWYRCGVDGGGGCCPSGYRCASKCLATQSGVPGSVLKAPPINQAVDLQGWGSWMIALTGVIGSAMILL